jgi:hypothetical protein
LVLKDSNKHSLTRVSDEQLSHIFMSLTPRDLSMRPARHRVKGWTATTLNDILLNTAYTGRTYSVSRRRREGELIEAQ